MSSWMMQLDPELGDLMLNDEEHLVVMLGLRQRTLLREQAVEREIAGVAEPLEKSLTMEDSTGR